MEDGIGFGRGGTCLCESADPETSTSETFEAPCECADVLGDSAALGFFRQTLGGATDRREMAVVEIAQFDAVREQNAVPLPVEAVGEDDLALGAEGHVGQLDRGDHLVAQTKIDLVGMWFGEGMRFPRGHTPIMPHRGATMRHRRYTRLPVKTTSETLEGNRVKLSVEVDEADFARDIDAAFAKIAQEVRLPGFRAGKAPRKVLEARIGIAAAREQALRDGVPRHLASAVRELNVDIIATPEIEITGGQDSGAVTFDATCEVRPVITVPGYGGLRVEVSAIEVTDAEVDEVVDAERRRLGKLTTVDRVAAVGDYVVVDLVGRRDGEPVAGLAVDEWSYEIGKKWVAPSFDDQLVGSTAGTKLSFTDTPSGTNTPADFDVTVTAVQELVIAEVTDAWVAENIDGHDTVEAWRDSVRTRLSNNRLNQVRNSVVEKVTDALAALVEIDAPESMVAADLQRRVENTIRQFQMQGINIDQWLQATGQDAASFVEGIRPQSIKACKVDLALRAVVLAEGLEATEDDIEREFEGMADRSNEAAIRQAEMQGGGKNKKIRLYSAEQVRAAYQANDAIVDLAAEIAKSKALDWLIHRVEYVDPAGNALDRDTVIGHSEADHHNHDHSGHDHSEHDHADHDHADQD